MPSVSLRGPSLWAMMSVADGETDQQNQVDEDGVIIAEFEWPFSSASSHDIVIFFTKANFIIGNFSEMAIVANLLIRGMVGILI